MNADVASLVLAELKFPVLTSLVIAVGIALIGLVFVGTVIRYGTQAASGESSKDRDEDEDQDDDENERERRRRSDD